MSDVTAHDPSPFFLAPYSEQTYWTANEFIETSYYLQQGDGGSEWLQFDTDVSYGTRKPPAPPDNQVFFYWYVLPYYLQAVLILISVGAALFPADFGKTVERQQAALVRFSAFLRTLHDMIVGGITQLTPTFLPGGGDEEMQGVAQDFPPPVPNDPTPPASVGLSIEWGAVEKYSGFSSVRRTYFAWATAPEWPAPFPFPIGSNVQKKLQIRALRETIAVYAGVGLIGVSSAINSLNRLAGQPPLPRHPYAGWSFREIFAEALIFPRHDGFRHVSDVAVLLRDTYPGDTAPQTGPLSLRKLLEPS
jgi:hypothetical protein